MPTVRSNSRTPKMRDHAQRVIDLVRKGDVWSHGVHVEPAEAIDQQVDLADVHLASMVLSGTPSNRDLLVLRTELRRRYRDRHAPYRRRENIRVEPDERQELVLITIMGPDSYQVAIDAVSAKRIARALSRGSFITVPTIGAELMSLMEFAQGNVALVIHNRQAELATGWIDTPTSILNIGDALMLPFTRHEV